MRRFAPIGLSLSLILFSGNHATTQDKGKDIIVSIAVAESHFSKRQPVRVKITIENISLQEIHFWAEYLFDLKTFDSISRQSERLGDRYYSRSGIATKNGQLILVPEDLNKAIRVNRTTSRFVNEQVSLAKGETKQISVDLTDLLWADGMWASWPHDRFFDVILKGKFQLWFELNGDTVHAISHTVNVEFQ